MPLLTTKGNAIGLGTVKLVENTKEAKDLGMRGVFRQRRKRRGR